MSEHVPVLEEKMKDAIVAELQRQAEIRPGRLKVSAADERLTVDGEIDLDDLVMVVVGSMAGGP